MSDGTCVSEKSVDTIRDALGLYILPDNRVLLCGKESHNICLFTENGRYIRTVVDREIMLEYPCALSYCEQQEMIYVSCKQIETGPDMMNWLKVFKCELKHLCPQRS